MPFLQKNSILVFILVLTAYAQNVKNDVVKYYNVKNIIKYDRLREQKAFSTIISYVKQNFRYKYIEVLRQNFMFVLCTDLETHFDIYMALLKPEKLLNGIKPYKYQNANHIFYSVPKNLQKKREVIASKIIHKNFKVSQKTVEQLIQAQGHASSAYKLENLKNYSYKILKIQGTDKNNYICLVRVYTPIDSERDTYCRITNFSMSGQICNDSFFSVGTSFYFLDACKIIKQHNLDILEVDIDYFLTKKSKKNYHFLVNKKGCLYLQNFFGNQKHIKISECSWRNRDFWIFNFFSGMQYLNLPRENELLSYLNSEDIIEVITACKILKNFKDKNSNKIVNSFLLQNKNSIISNELNHFE